MQSGDIVIVQQKKSQVWKWVLVGCLSVVVVVGIGVLVWSLIPKEYDRINIVNASELSSVGRDEVNEFRLTLLNVLRERGLDMDSEEKIDIEVRDGTVNSFEKYKDGKERKTINFIVDIDSLRQTYDVTIYKDSGTANGIMVAVKCPNVAEQKYDDNECVGVSENSGKAVGLYLPYEMTLASGEKVLVKKLGLNSEGLLDLKIYLYSCDEENPPVTETEAVIKKWVEELGDPVAEHYTYDVRAGYCEGDAI